MIGSLCHALIFGTKNVQNFSGMFLAASQDCLICDLKAKLPKEIQVETAVPKTLVVDLVPKKQSEHGNGYTVQSLCPEQSGSPMFEMRDQLGIKSKHCT